MCGRYAIVPDPRSWAPIGEIFSPPLLEVLRGLDPRYNVAPTQQVPVIYMERDTRKVVVELARWGFVPHWSKDLKMSASTINARSEEAPSKPMWRDAWRGSRCLSANRRARKRPRRQREADASRCPSASRRVRKRPSRQREADASRCPRASRRARKRPRRLREAGEEMAAASAAYRPSKK